jgi:MFS family permease
MFNGSRVVGPSVAGVIVAAAGVGWCFAINAASFLAVLTSLLLMRADELVPLERTRRPTVLRGIREGLGYVRRSPRIRTVLTMTAILSTVGFNFHVLVPVLASETLHAGPQAFGLLSASFGLGALTGALLAAALARASWKALLAGTAGFSLTLLLLAPAGTVLVCAALLYATGVCFTLWTANSQSILQLTAPDHLRGRVVSIYLFAFAGFAPIGGLLAGWLAEIGGTGLAFGLAGVVSAAVTLVAARGHFAVAPARA